MRNGTKISGMVAAATVLAIAGSASAASMVLTLDGTVNGTGYDNLGLFGTTSGTFYGDIKLQFYYDPERGERSVVSGAGFEDIRGGPGYIPDTYVSPITKMTITANGQEASFSGFHNVRIATYAGNYLLVDAQLDLPPGGTFRPYALVSLWGGPLPSSLTDAYSAVVACTACAEFVIAEPVPGSTRSKVSIAQINLSRVSIAAAPEPATWALMIGGFGMAGAALRRRRTSAVAA
jgi:hypothetical protein